ncbi:MAG: hypothetical protein JEZ03_17305 [Bacteroidales bacterium]|nr:hypothetical protein [Bacteroidales bacterium]
MILQIINFEIRTALQTKLTYIYFAILFTLAFLFMNAIGGAFSGFQIQVAGDNIKINSPMVIDLVLSFFSLLGIFITAGIISNIIYKDFKYDSLSLTFTTQVSKFDFLIGRFTAAIIINLLVFLAPALGIILGTYMPYLNQDLFGEFIPMAYINTYLTRILPNLFFVSAVFFTLTLLLRNIVVNWFVIIILYVLYALGGRMLSDLDNRTIASLLDPFGMAASLNVSSNFSADDANNEVVPLVSVYLWNRILWVGIGIITLLFGYFRFNFSFNIERLLKKRIKQTKADQNPATEGKTSENSDIRSFKPNFGLNHNIRSFLSLFRKELKGLITNIYFILIMVVGISFLILASQAIGKIYDTETYPVTYQVIEILGGTFNLFMMIIIILFSGEMVHQARSLKVHETDNILPLKNWHFLGSKITALIVVEFIMLIVLLACGVGVQAYRAYFNFEIGLYIKSVLGLQFSAYVLITLLAFFVQILVNQKFLGYALMIIYYIWDAQFAAAVLQNKLFIFGSDTGYMYSDMNGFSEGLWVVLLYRFYWLAFALSLTVIANRFIIRGTEEQFKMRWHSFKSSYLKIRIMIPVLMIIFLTTGGFIFYNTNVVNEFNSSHEMEKQSAQYEKLYKQYESIIQPKITSVNAYYNLFPESGDAHINGDYMLKNKSSQDIDTLILSMDKKLVKSLNVSVGFKPLIADDKLGFFMYQLDQSILPGDSITLSFDIENKAEGFSNQGVDVTAHKNGSFVYNTDMPAVGYNPEAELRRKQTRKKHNLPEKTLEFKRDDPKGLASNFITDDADFIRLNIQVSTSEDQIALAPGYCTKQWNQNGRNYYNYKSDVPVINYFAVLSARYELAEDRWIPENENMKAVDIKIYYHKGHNYNLDNMIKGVKASLSYYSKHYCEYPHPELKIVEFPRFGSFAQSFPAMIPFSEGLGFIADLTEKEGEQDFEDLKIDYPFWVTAHEMAHQWLAHHLIAANTEGAQMLMESLTQFSSIMVIKESYGPERLKKFMREELFRYNSSRKSESFEEQALATVHGHQQAIYYQKGVIVFNALNDYLGEDKLVNLIGEFINTYKFKGAPYATTTEFINELKQITPDSLQYIVSDWLEKITFYDFKLNETSYERNENLEYFVNLKLTAAKTYADGLGKETQAGMNDYVEIGIYNKNDQEIHLKKYKLQSGENILIIPVDRKPSKVIIDPWYKLITKDIRKAEMKIDKK